MGALRNDHLPYMPVIALRSILVFMSVASMVMHQSDSLGIALRSAIAMEYGSSPVAHPALHILSRLSPFSREQISSGRICS